MISLDIDMWSKYSQWNSPKFFFEIDRNNPYGFCCNSLKAFMPLLICFLHTKKKHGRENVLWHFSITYYHGNFHMYKKMELFHSDHLIAYHIDSKISIILYTYHPSLSPFTKLLKILMHIKISHTLLYNISRTSVSMMQGRNSFGISVILINKFPLLVKLCKWHSEFLNWHTELLKWHSELLNNSFT